ncbi:gliding motility protein RemB [uncultured Dokdonia sp.]|uniref:gliding motility protein RemB n=1 Tax=uncultured Dokdonia sp. TaxID=575653 RepID=UPI0030ED184F|tara:strand:- start:16045 stop:18174 length:2130 start_codon:yes stop_codon:yes gene_type:complete
MHKYVFLLFVFATCSLTAQVTTSDYEKYPVFPECADLPVSEVAACFNETFISFIIDHLEVPAEVNEENYEGKMVILFEVTREGTFKLLYTDAVFASLKTSAQEVFDKLPIIDPATYNGEPTYMQFTMPVLLPLSPNKIGEMNNGDNEGDAFAKAKKETPLKNPMQDEYDRIQNQKFNPANEYTSQLNIPFSHQVYSRFDQELNLVGTNAHTASKPYLYQTVNPYYNFQEKTDALKKEKKTWFGRKWSNEHMVQIQGEDYWITLDPAADLQLGYETDDLKSDSFTYNNTRAVYIQGGLGKKLNFFAAVYESQGRFPRYFDAIARSLRPDGGNPAIVPGRGIAKEGTNGDLDYPVAEGYISYTPSKYFNIQLGHGKQFIGDGYRSLLLSDNASNFPYLKLNTTFWKFKYTNTWTSLRDVRPEVTADGAFRTKFMSNHYLSWNLSKKLNVGLFESVIWEDENGRGFDFNFLNPVIFYRAIEFSTGSRGGNALIGLTGKYKVNDRVNVYGQVVIDEFSASDVIGGNQSYKNKQGFQIGAKYYDAFGVKNLTLQGEYNQVRPYVYSNNEIQLNYGHANQSLAHQWGANFKELIGIARYERERWYGTAKLIVGARGVEIGDINEVYYGGSIYGNDENRPSDDGIAFFQGNKVNSLYADLELGYLINPATNLKVYANPIYRNVTADIQDAPNTFDTNTLWLNIGFRTDLFNWYYDY